MSEADFDNLVRNTGRRLYSMAYRFLRDQQASEDAVQEVFFIFFESRLHFP